MKTKLTAIFLALVLASASLASCNGSTVDTGAVSDTAAESESSTDSSTDTSFVPEADPNVAEISASSANFSLSNAEMSYLFKNQYENLLYSLSQNGMSLSSISLDTSSSLKTQECPVDDSVETWFDYFLKSTKSEAEQLLALCEAARAAGIDVTDDTKALADATIADIKEYAEQNSYTLEEYIKLMFGSSVTEDTVRRMLELSSLASAYIEARLAKTDLSDEALEAAYDDNRSSYETVDYVTYAFDVSDLISEDATDSERRDAMVRINAYASELSKCRDKDSFLAYAKKNMVNVLGLTESEAETAQSQLICEGAKYSESSKLSKWAFSADIGDIYTEESPATEGLIKIYLLTAKNSRSEAVAKCNVRHILFLSEDYEDDTKVREVYDSWVADGADEEEFLKLVKEYSGDPGSVNNGGLYEDVSVGEMVDEFNDWIFDANRKHGDHGIVKTSYGWHIMYYESGLPQWKYDMKQKLLDKAYSDLSAELDETEVTFNDELLASLPA